MITDRVFKFLSRSYQLELEAEAVTKLYPYLLWHSLLLTFFIMGISYVFKGLLPFSLFKMWGLPTFLICNLSLGLTYFTYKKQSKNLDGLWVNWLMAVALVIASSFALLPWVSFAFLPLSHLILLTLFMSLTPVLALVALKGSEKIWLAAVLPVMFSLILYSATAWVHQVAFGQWLALWATVLTLLMYIIQRKQNRLIKLAIDIQKSELLR